MEKSNAKAVKDFINKYDGEGYNGIMELIEVGRKKGWPDAGIARVINAIKPDSLSHYDLPYDD